MKPPAAAEVVPIELDLEPSGLIESYFYIHVPPRSKPNVPMAVSNFVCRS